MGSAADVLELLRNYWAVLLGNTLEWYEFAVYGCLEVVMLKSIEWPKDLIKAIEIVCFCIALNSIQFVRVPKRN